GQKAAADIRVVVVVVNLDHRRSALADDQVRKAVAVDVAGRDEYATGKARAKRPPRAERSAIQPVGNADFCHAAGAPGGNDVGNIVAIHIGQCDADAAGVIDLEGHEAEPKVAVLRIVDVDPRRCPRIHAGGIEFVAQIAEYDVGNTLPTLSNNVWRIGGGL